MNQIMLPDLLDNLKQLPELKSEFSKSSLNKSKNNIKSPKNPLKNSNKENVSQIFKPKTFTKPKKISHPLNFQTFRSFTANSTIDTNPDKVYKKLEESFQHKVFFNSKRMESIKNLSFITQKLDKKLKNPIKKKESFKKSTPPERNINPEIFYSERMNFSRNLNKKFEEPRKNFETISPEINIKSFILARKKFKQLGISNDVNKTQFIPIMKGRHIEIFTKKFISDYTNCLISIDLINKPLHKDEVGKFLELLGFMDHNSNDSLEELFLMLTTKNQHSNDPYCNHLVVDQESLLAFLLAVLNIKYKGNSSIFSEKEIMKIHKKFQNLWSIKMSKIKVKNEEKSKKIGQNHKKNPDSFNMLYVNFKAKQEKALKTLFLKKEMQNIKELEECTFKPKIHLKSINKQAKYFTIAKIRKDDKDPRDIEFEKEKENCIFYPQLISSFVRKSSLVLVGERKVRDAEKNIERMKKGRWEKKIKNELLLRGFTNNQRLNKSLRDEVIQKEFEILRQRSNTLDKLTLGLFSFGFLILFIFQIQLIFQAFCVRKSVKRQKRIKGVILRKYNFPYILILDFLNFFKQLHYSL